MPCGFKPLKRAVCCIIGAVMQSVSMVCRRGHQQRYTLTVILNCYVFCEVLNLSVKLFLSFNTERLIFGAGYRTILKV